MRLGILLVTAMTTILPMTVSHAQSVQDYINDYRALESAAQQCNEAVNQHFQQMRWAISHGMSPSPQPMCLYNAPRVIARMAYDETQTKRLQGVPTTYCDTGVCNAPQYLPQPSSRRSPPDNTDMEHIINGEEVTRKGNVRQIGPNGDHHFDCGPEARNVTAQSFNPYPNVCVER